MAGLLAARVLSDDFARVTVIERDDPLDDAEPRNGVPQGAHAHALLSRGLEILSGRFPGLIDELLAGGAVQADAATVAWHQRGGWKLRHVPDGFVVIGDAVCSFNPVYGQGMTISALEALWLDACLWQQPSASGLSRRFHRRTARIVGDAWKLATGEDFQYAATEGRR